MSLLFVTGTDTGVGKTVVTALVVASLRFRGFKVAVMKPVETGCSVGKSGELWASDAELLRKAADVEELISDKELCPFRFAAAVAPEVAAEKEDMRIDPHIILDTLEKLKKRFDLVLVEGAGGLLVPVVRDMLTRDLAKKMGAPLLVVGRAGLGTINHCLLTVQAALSGSVPVAGIVLNNPVDLQTNVDPSLEDNARLISYYSCLPVWGPLPYDQRVASGKIPPWESRVLLQSVSSLVEELERTIPA